MHFVNAKGILSAHNGMNLYRGCTHGCIYCDSRSACYQFTHAFEDIEVKRNAPELLRRALSAKRARCMIGTGAMCDPYMPCEKTLRLTRQCLEIIDEYGFGLAIQTKSDLILRDAELLAHIHKRARCVAQMTLTTYDEELCAVIEPNVCGTRARYEALCALDRLGVETVVWLSPILPFINDTEENLLGVLDLCFGAHVRGIVCFDMGVTLRQGDREYFYAALDRHFPGVKQRYVRAFGNAYKCVSPRGDTLMRIFEEQCARRGVMYRADDVLADMRRLSASAQGEQMSLFDLLP